jgi:hypothetical protein
MRSVWPCQAATTSAALPAARIREIFECLSLPSVILPCVVASSPSASTPPPILSRVFGIWHVLPITTPPAKSEAGGRRQTADFTIVNPASIEGHREAAGGRGALVSLPATSLRIATDDPSFADWRLAVSIAVYSPPMTRNRWELPGCHRGLEIVNPVVAQGETGVNRGYQDLRIGNP